MRLPTLLITTLAIAAALPAAARADIASFDGTTVTVRGTDSPETLVLSMTASGQVEINADEAGPGCTTTIFDSVVCPLAGGGVRIDTYGGNDSVTALDLTEGSVPLIAADLGAGNDTLKGGAGREVVAGGPGNDTLDGRGGDDSFDGGDGNDTLTGDAGRDELHGGAGDDLLDGDRFEAPEADVMDGGPGNDKAEGWNIPDEDTHPPVSVTLDGAANDGRPGEGDDVRDIERFQSQVSGTFVTSDAADSIDVWANLDYGTSTIRSLGGNDVVKGANASENIDGGAGDDRLEGGYGDDTITGGPGRDTIIGDKSGSECGLFESCSLPVGNDTIDARDGEPDSITCGVGTDRVLADTADTVAGDCEQVERTAAAASPAAGGKPGKALKVKPVKLRSALKRGLKVTLVGTSGKVNAKHGRKLVASGKGKGTVTLRFTKAAKRSLARVRSVKLTLSAPGATAKVTLKR
jgi:Ca2+-binding RTX toxin-like protein